MTSRTSSLTDLHPDARRARAGFFIRQRELARRRLWPIALTFLCYVIYHVIAVATALSAAARDAALQHITAAEKIRGMQSALQDILGMQSVSWLLITLPLAAVLAIEGFAWMDNRREVDFYESLPTPRGQRFRDICIGSVLYFFFAYVCTLEIGLLIAGGFGALSRALLIEILQFAAKNIAFFLAVYALGVLSAMLTGNVIVAWLAFAVLLFYELILRAILRGYCSEFFATWSGRHIPALDESLLSPFGYIFRTDRPYPRTVVSLLLLAALFFLLAWICYRLRKNEYAESAVVFAPVRTVVRIAIALMAGLMTGILFSSMWTDHGILIPVLWMTLFTVITACIMQIIYEYDFRALFHRPLEIGIAVVLSLLVYLGFVYDLTGYDRFVPDPDKVSDAAMIYIDYSNEYCTEEGRQISSQDFGEAYMHLDNVEDVLSLAEYGQEYTRKVRSLHGQEDLIVMNREEGEAAETGFRRPSEEFDFLAVYRMKNGSTIARRFSIPCSMDPAMMDAVVGKLQYRKGAFAIYHDNAIRAFADNFYISCTNGKDERSTGLSSAQYEALREAYINDLAVFSYHFARVSRPVARVNLAYHEVREGDPNPDLENLSVSFPVYPAFANTIRVLQDCGIWLTPLDFSTLPKIADYDRLSRADQDLLDELDLSVFSGPFHNLLDENLLD